MKWVNTLLVAMLALLQGCKSEIIVPPVQGAVTDLVTGQPIADVDVVVLYMGGGRGSDGHYYTGCAANQITTTDANGHWAVASRRLGVNPDVLRYSILLYKDGYREGSPGRYKEANIEKRMTSDKDVYEYDDSYPYQKKRDYQNIIKGWGSKELYQQTVLTPNHYLGSNILGSGNDHQYLFVGCGEEGADDPGLNAIAQRLIVKWLDTAPEKTLWGFDNACETIAHYVKRHPDFMGALHATETRSQTLKRFCGKTERWGDTLAAPLGIK